MTILFWRPRWRRARTCLRAFSKFKVGAAIEDEAGRIHTGCNVENATYGLTVCAERVAVFKAISEGRAQVPARGSGRRHRDADAALRRVPADPLGILRRRGNHAGQSARQNRNLSLERTLPESHSMFRICSFLLFASRSPLEPADWIWSARYVITMDAQHRVIENGAVAVRGDRIVGVGTKAEIDARFQARAAAGPAGCHPRARPHQHAHACRHVAVPRHRRRS